MDGQDGGEEHAHQAGGQQLEAETVPAQLVLGARW